MLYKIQRHNEKNNEESTTPYAIVALKRSYRAVVYHIASLPFILLVVATKLRPNNMSTVRTPPKIIRVECMSFEDADSRAVRAVADQKRHTSDFRVFLLSKKKRKRGGLL